MPVVAPASSACAANRSRRCAAGWATTTSSGRLSKRSASSTMRCCGRMTARRGARGQSVIKTHRAQRSFGDGLIAEEVKDLHEAWMKHADQLLGDPQIVAAVYEALAQRHPQSRKRGRPGVPAEVVLRLLVLKHMRNWSYEVVEREVRANLVYRDFTRVGEPRRPTPRPWRVGAWRSGRRWCNRSMSGLCISPASTGWRPAGACGSTPPGSGPTFIIRPTAVYWAMECGR